MAFVEDSPDLWTQTEGVRQYLKYDVAIGRPKTVLAQGGQAKRMGGVVRKVEPAFQGIRSFG